MSRWPSRLFRQVLASQGRQFLAPIQRRHLAYCLAGTLRITVSLLGGDMPWTAMAPSARIGQGLTAIFASTQTRGSLVIAAACAIQIVPQAHKARSFRGRRAKFLRNGLAAETLALATSDALTPLLTGMPLYAACAAVSSSYPSLPEIRASSRTRVPSKPGT